MTDPGERDAPALVDEILGPEPAEDALDAPDAGDVMNPMFTTRTLGTVPIRRGGRRSMRGPEGLGCRDIALTTVGFAVFVLIDAVMMYAPFRMRGEPSLLPQLFTLVLLAFGFGGLLVWQVRGVWRPVGIGLMLGWVFMTLISAGFLTGLNP